MDGMQPQAKVGVIGLGIIGTVFASHYEREGVLGATYNRTPKVGAPRGVATPDAVAAAASVLHVVVSGPGAVNEVLERIEPALDATKLVVQSSTIDPGSAQRFAERVRARGARYVEAPFMGSQPAAEAKKVVFLLGGDPVDLDAVNPWLARLSGERRRVGSVPDAAALKLSYNVLVGITMQGICESLASARRAGIPDAVYFDSLRGSALWSGLAAIKEPKLRTSDFAPQFSVRHLHKDLLLAGDMTGSGRLPLAEVVRDRLAEMEADGAADLDMCALIHDLLP